VVSAEDRPLLALDSSPVLLFDGVCNVCNSAVNFVIDRDPGARFRFASLQSEAARVLCSDHGVGTDGDTIVLVCGGAAYTESTAVLRVLRSLGGFWALFYVFIVVPKPVRDAAYRCFAAHRYRWFGKRETCRIPTPEIRARFLG
jgi:predicted DCC family thiol-disulfide oxidoreductase YuxK